MPDIPSYPPLTPIAGAETTVISQGGQTKSVTLARILAFITAALSR